MTQRTDTGDSPPIESRDDLISIFEGGEKVRDNWRIGTEHEKFVYRMSDHRAPSHDEPGGIRDLLVGLTEYGWKPVEEGGEIIALSGEDGTISLEPAGQFELSGAALRNLHQTCSEAARHLDQCKAVGERLGLGFLGLGMWPDKTLCRTAGHAQGPLCGHAQLYAEGRLARARHDASYLYHTG